MSIHDHMCECSEGRDDLYHCISCDACCFGWGTFGSKYDDYMIDCDMDIFFALVSKIKEWLQ